jgi:hypothetical protein
MGEDFSSGSDVQVHRDEAGVVTVKMELPDRSRSESSDGESGQEPFTCVNIKQEVEVSWVQLNRYAGGHIMYCCTDVLVDRLCIAEQIC